MEVVTEVMPTCRERIEEMTQPGPDGEEIRDPREEAG